MNGKNFFKKSLSSSLKSMKSYKSEWKVSYASYEAENLSYFRGITIMNRKKSYS
ncbi:hypothetical protein IPA_02575 [Ignicoccus pacificus DSM 13166]|uniref:Uncharacterized protein n=1 Tax=Ignicoccus pacificus DSM 13166 TaxID=940294 RepID=A0A977KAV1_9CREN|nr:hypothetical protein IPA_02575 [Ignicoccus pacificus DSM 13166]